MAPMISAFADECNKDFNVQLEAVRKNNITHIEMRRADDAPIQKHTLDSICEIKRRADDAGVKFSAAGSPLGKYPVNDDIEPQREMCKHLIEICHILETPYIRMFSFHIPKGEDPDDYRQQVLDKLGALVEVAQGTGVMLAHENENGIYGDTGKRCLDIYETFYSSGALKGVFDFANFIQAKQDPIVDCWPILKEYTEYFHIKDALLENGRVQPAGQGDGNMKKILGEAIGNGFNNFLTLEPHLGAQKYGEDPAVRFEIAASALHELLAEIG